MLIAQNISLKTSCSQLIEFQGFIKDFHKRNKREIIQQAEVYFLSISSG